MTRTISIAPVRKSVIVKATPEHRNFERMGSAEGETMRNAVDNGWPGLLNLYVAATATST